MPKLADTMTEGTLVKWRKNEGDKVEAGDVVAEVETDKATMEMEAFDDGMLHKYLVAGRAESADRRQHRAAAEAGRKAARAGAEPRPPPRTPRAKPKPKPRPAEAETSPRRRGRRAASAPPASASRGACAAGGARVKSSPLARKMAREKGIDLATLHGSGPGGRIVARDVQEQANGSAQTGAAAAPAGAPGRRAAAVPSMPAGPNDSASPSRGMRRVIAERLLASKTQLPHFYLHIEVDAGAAHAAARRAQCRQRGRRRPEAHRERFRPQGRRRRRASKCPR